MDDKQLEQMLYDLGKEEIQPSKELIYQTKAAIRNKTIYFAVLASMLLNALMIVGLILLDKKYPILKYIISGGLCIQLLMSVLSVCGLLVIENQFQTNKD